MNVRLNWVYDPMPYKHGSSIRNMACISRMLAALPVTLSILQVNRITRRVSFENAQAKNTSTGC